MQLTHLGVVLAAGRVDQRQPRRVEHPGVAAQGAQQARGFLGRQPAIGAFAQRAVQQQEARRVTGAGRCEQRRRVGPFEPRGIEVGQEIGGVRHGGPPRR
jgi:hypothetical protein